MDPNLVPAIVIAVAFVAVCVFPRVTMLVLGFVGCALAALYSYGVAIDEQIGAAPERSLPFLFIGIFMAGFARWAMQRQ